MSSTVQTDFYTVVRERRSVRHYDPAHELSERELEELLDIANRAPSSWNLQHWKFLAVTDREMKRRLLPIANGQKQVVEASAVIAVLGDIQANRNAEAVFEPDVRAGLMPRDVKSDLIRQVEDAYAGASAFSRDEAIRNASLAAMQLMLAAKAAGLDSCPMAGFDADRLVEAFGIPSNYVPVMLVAIGKAAVPARPSSRLPVERTIVWNRF